MTDEHEPNETTSRMVADVETASDLHLVSRGLPQKGLNQETLAQTTLSTDLNYEPDVIAQAKSEQKDAAIGILQAPDSHTKQMDEKSENPPQNANLEHKMDDKPYSIFTHNEKRIIVLCAGLCAFFSPISSAIYFPSLDAIAKDLHVSYSLVNLSITTYMASVHITET